jgi:hypothetical protein
MVWRISGGTSGLKGSLGGFGRVEIGALRSVCLSVEVAEGSDAMMRDGRRALDRGRERCCDMVRDSMLDGVECRKV